jgi:hypothetical protein
MMKRTEGARRSGNVVGGCLGCIGAIGLCLIVLILIAAFTAPRRGVIEPESSPLVIPSPAPSEPIAAAPAPVPGSSPPRELLFQGTLPDRAVPEAPAELLSLDGAEAEHAQVLMDEGARLERLGKTVGAIDQYRIVWMEYEGTDVAQRAGSRIFALGGKIPTEIESRSFREKRHKLVERKEKAEALKRARQEAAEEESP